MPSSQTYEPFLKWVYLFRFKSSLGSTCLIHQQVLGIESRVQPYNQHCCPFNTNQLVPQPIHLPSGSHLVLGGQAKYFSFTSAQIPSASLLCGAACAPNRVLVPSSPVSPASLLILFPLSSCYFFHRRRSGHPNLAFVLW